MRDWDLHDKAKHKLDADKALATELQYEDNYNESCKKVRDLLQDYYEDEKKNKIYKDKKHFSKKDNNS